MIEVDEVTKTFGDVRALNGVSLRVAKGTVLGLLGHNGAGKTTLINILATVLPPSGGSARVAGFDVTTQGHQVRARIGLTGQFAAIDQQLSGRANIHLITRLLGASRREARACTDELLEVFGLTSVADRPARTYSGGQRRRIDLAVSLVGRPDVVFLDEPTAGLDPTSRVALWKIVQGLVEDGTTVLLTTQYLDEADRLADRIAVLAHGEVVASGTARELKAEQGQRMVHISLADEHKIGVGLAALRGVGLEPVRDGASMSLPVSGAAGLAVVVRALDEVGAEVTELAFTEPTLDDVFLSLAAETVATPAE